MRKVLLFASIVTSTSFLATLGCSTTQKTPGVGLTSAVAQNVLRIAAVEALRGVDFSPLKGQAVEEKMAGFDDEKHTAEFLGFLFKSKAEQAGARFVPSGKGTIEMEIATLTAGDDSGRSSFPLISHSERVEGGVNVELTFRNRADGKALEDQPVRGQAKYEQTTVIGIQGHGSYYVKDSKGKYEKVPDPATFQ